MRPQPFFHKAPIRWGLLGCGDVAEVKSGPAYQMVDGFEVTMVMRRNAEKVKDFALRHGIARYTTDAMALIEDPEVDAVYIATPPDTHKKFALQVAAAGKPCCVEKPMAPSYADSMAIYEAFKAKEIPLFIAHYRRSLPRFNQVKEWLHNEKIGKVSELNWHLAKPPNQKDLTGAPNWRTNPKVAPGGYFDDLASHGLDLFSYYFGKVKEVSGVAENQLGLYGAHDFISGSWSYENGITASGSWNFTAQHRGDRVTIEGSEGTIRFSIFDEIPLELYTDDGVESINIAHPKHIQQFHVENIKKHLLGEQRHPSMGEDGLHISWVMDKILGTVP